MAMIQSNRVRSPQESGEKVDEFIDSLPAALPALRLRASE